MNPGTFEQGPGDTVRSLVTSRARVLTGTSGAISSSRLHGMTITKTADETGRYSVQAVDASGASCGIFRLQEIRVGIWSPTADAAITAGKAVGHIVRSVNEAAGTFLLQFFAQLTDDDAATVVDAELENGSTFTLSFVSERNQVTP